MLARGRSVLIYLAIALVLLLLLGWTTQQSEWGSEVISNLKDSYLSGSHTSNDHASRPPPPLEEADDAAVDLPFPTSPPSNEETSWDKLAEEEQGFAENTPVARPPESSSGRWDADDYIFVQSSKLSPNKKWYKIIFGEQGSYNPNILPHPWKENTWYMIAQAAQYPGETKAALYSKENICEAAFKDGHMQCIRPQTSLPIASTISEHCSAERAWFNKMIGPTDARVFYGPDAPYIQWGSASGYTCYGLYIQDLRRLANWDEFVYPEDRFFWPTEIRRPAPWGPVEKNWFPFWSDDGEMYLHHDYEPRVFSKVSDDGKSVGENLAKASDEACLAKYKPKLTHEEDAIHQATNSLAVTMCKRTDPTCIKSNQNTFVISIFQRKTPHEHNIYQPYVLMFNQSAPFNVHGISSKPIWLNGREKPEDKAEGEPEMMYITSMNWVGHNMTYHGYLDDDIFLNFGIDDTIAGTIDVSAGDLLQGIGLCG